jgi:Na+(H+)/acetate symporter ActP
VIYATAGGIKSCIWADFFQYSVAMFGAVYAAVVACRQPEVGGFKQLADPSECRREIELDAGFFELAGVGAAAADSRCGPMVECLVSRG